MSKSQRVPENVVYVVIAILVAGCVGIALAWGAVAGSRALAVLIALHALGRLLLPDGMVPRVRTRMIDGVGGLLAAGMLWYLSAWGATILVAY